MGLHSNKHHCEGLTLYAVPAKEESKGGKEVAEKYEKYVDWNLGIILCVIIWNILSYQYNYQ